MYVVGNRHVNVEREGKLVTLNPGEPVPEADEWAHDIVMRCMKVGQLVSMERAPKNTVQSLGRKVGKIAEAAPASKPLSTSEANNGPRTTGKSSARKYKRSN